MTELYNRYIPQPDGSYKRRRVQDPTPPEPKQAPIPPPPEIKTAPPQMEIPVQTAPPTRRKQQSSKTQSQNHDSIPNFFKQLLPKNMDTGDLLIILLLLLMAGDREEDRNNALLTLAIYFFM